MENFIIGNSAIHVFMSLVTLTVLEIVLGIDNLVFIAVLSQRLPEEQQVKAQRVGLTFAWVTRVLLLACAVYLTRLTQPVFIGFGFSLSIRDLFLLLGGIFLIIKAIEEIHTELDEADTSTENSHNPRSFIQTILQIAVLDIVFSLDSILTAVGLTDEFWVMAAAITIAILMMIVASKTLSDFIKTHPTVKMLAFSFLILIGTVLIADGLGEHIPRGYIYMSVAFATFVEALNVLNQKKHTLKARAE